MHTNKIDEDEDFCDRCMTRGQGRVRIAEHTRRCVIMTVPSPPSITWWMQNRRVIGKYGVVNGRSITTAVRSAPENEVWIGIQARVVRKKTGERRLRRKYVRTHTGYVNHCLAFACARDRYEQKMINGQSSHRVIIMYMYITVIDERSNLIKHYVRERCKLCVKKKIE